MPGFWAPLLLFLFPETEEVDGLERKNLAPQDSEEKFGEILRNQILQQFVIDNLFPAEQVWGEKDAGGDQGGKVSGKGGSLQDWTETAERWEEARMEKQIEMWKAGSGK